MADSSISEISQSSNEQDNTTVVLNNTNQENTSSRSSFNQSDGKPPESATNPFVLRSSILTPSKLNAAESPLKRAKFVLTPSRLAPVGGDDESKEAPSSSSAHSRNDLTNGIPKPTFIPLVQNGSDAPKAPAAAPPTTQATPRPAVVANSTFVFGQNLQERVVAESKTDNDLKNDTSSTASPAITSNGSGDNMLFSSALASSGTSSTTTTTSVSTPNKSLSESAREYEESRAVKRKYEEIEVITGEEDEVNIMQITCKLFAFDNGSGGITSWQERGRGTMRLNDSVAYTDGYSSHSRLVFRTSGSLRVILNTKVWSGMTVEAASEKSIRLTALDNGEIKVFLIMGNSEDVNQLKKHLERRVFTEVERQKRQQPTTDYGPDLTQS